MSSIDIKNAYAAYPAATESEMLHKMAQAHGCRLIYKYANDYGDKVTHTDYKVILAPGDEQEQAFLNTPMIHNPVLVYRDGAIVSETLPEMTSNGQVIAAPIAKPSAVPILLDAGLQPQNETAPSAPPPPLPAAPVDWNSVLKPSNVKPTGYTPPPPPAPHMDWMQADRKKKFLGAFEKVFGIIGTLITIIVTFIWIRTYQPFPPGELIPWKWRIIILLGGTVVYFVVSLFGLLVGTILWSISHPGEQALYPAETAPVRSVVPPVTTSPARTRRPVKARTLLAVLGILVGFGLVYWMLTRPPDLTAVKESVAQLTSKISDINLFPAKSTLAPSSVQTDPIKGICWTHPLTGFDGNRSQVWETKLDNSTRELLPFDQFKVDVVTQNPQLKDDGYIFYSQKTYQLPGICP